MWSLPHFFESERKGGFFFFVCGNQIVGQCSRAFLVETVETRDKYRDNFHFMQMSLAMSMRFIFAND